MHKDAERVWATICLYRLFFCFSIFSSLSLSLPIYYTKSFPLGNRAPLGVATTDERCNGIDDKGKKTMQP